MDANFYPARSATSPRGWDVACTAGLLVCATPLARRLKVDLSVNGNHANASVGVS
jgi:hypothetical protein